MNNDRLYLFMMFFHLVTRVRTQGTMTLTFNILLKDFSAMGYDIRSSSMSVLLPS